MLVFDFTARLMLPSLLLPLHEDDAKASVVRYFAEGVVVLLLLLLTLSSLLHDVKQRIEAQKTAIATPLRYVTE